MLSLAFFGLSVHFDYLNLLNFCGERDLDLDLRF